MNSITSLRVLSAAMFRHIFLALALVSAASVLALSPSSPVSAQGAPGTEPTNVQVVPGDATLTVSWTVTSRPGVADDSIRHALRWSQVSGVWANPRGPSAAAENGVVVEGGVSSYVITGLTNDVATGVFVRSFTGNGYSERVVESSPWVRVKGEHTTPRAAPSSLTLVERTPERQAQQGQQPAPVSCVIEELTYDATINTSWNDDLCLRSDNTGSYARFYTFTLSQVSVVKIWLSSDE